jgi:hypothetical protein
MVNVVQFKKTSLAAVEVMVVDDVGGDDVVTVGSIPILAEFIIRLEGSMVVMGGLLSDRSKG